MKKSLILLSAILLMALAVPQSLKAYDFSAVAPSGQMLYYSYNTGSSGSSVFVTYPGQSSSNPWGGYTSPSDTLIIPDSVTYNGHTYFVTSIGDSAFCQCRGLTSVTIGNSVTSIGNYVFGYCSGLTSITIPNSVTAIGSAFWGCLLARTNYTGTISQWCNIDFSDYMSNPAKYSQNLYINDTALSQLVIPNGVAEIKQYAFFGCTGLTSITIPNSVTSIGDFAFMDCSGLTGALTIPNSVTSIGYSAFASCSGLTGVLTIPNSVDSIGNYAFSNCGGLTSVTIPNSVTSIGQGAFSGCTGLTSITIPASITCIRSNTFQNCTGLTSVTIPNTVTSIGPEAFMNCNGLTSITIPNSVTSIGGYAFQYCRGLTEITSQGTVAPTLGTHAFEHVTSTIPVHIPCGSIASYSAKWSYFSNIVETPMLSISAVSADSTMGSVVVLTRPNCKNSTAIFEAVPNTGYHFTNWSDGDTTNPRTMVVTSDTTVTAVFAANQYTVTLEVNDTVMGHVTGAGVYNYSDTATLYAEAFPGYHFVQWGDGNTSNSRILLVTQDTTIVAFFSEGDDTTGIREAGMGNEGVRVYIDGRQIVVEAVSGESVMLYDAVGRLLATRREDTHVGTPLRFDVPASGVYLVKVGTLPAKKVVLIK